MRKICYITYSVKVFGSLAINTKSLKSKFSKSLAFQRLETVPNHTMLEKNWKDQASGKKCTKYYSLRKLNKMYIVYCTSSGSWKRGKYYMNLKDTFKSQCRTFLMVYWWSFKEIWLYYDFISKYFLKSHLSRREFELLKVKKVLHLICLSILNSPY